MISKNITEAILKVLTDSASLAALVGTNVQYARGGVENTYPLVRFFEVASSDGYQVDYNSVTFQFDAVALDAYTALQIKEVLYTLLNRFHGKVALSGGNVEINWSTMIDSGALPDTDLQLYGSFLRFSFKYRGKNLGGF